MFSIHLSVATVGIDRCKNHLSPFFVFTFPLYIPIKYSYIPLILICSIVGEVGVSYTSSEHTELVWSRCPG